MTIKPQSGKAKGSRLERQAAAILGGKRAPLSGGVGGGDIWLEQGSLFHDSFIFEAKARAKLPMLLVQAMAQAEVACKGTMKKPAVIYRENRGQMMVAFRLEDLVQFCQALAEVGNGYAIKQQLHSARKAIDEAERLA